MVRAVVLLWLLGCGRVAATSDASVDASQDASLDDGPIAHYLMDVLAGGMVADLTGNHHGECLASACPTVTAGQIDSAYLFDGTDDIIRVPFAQKLNTTNAFTVTAWINRNSTTDVGCFLNKVFGGAKSNSWQACVSDDDPLAFYSIGIGDTEHAQMITMSLDAGRWYHVALRWDGSMKALYVDAELQIGVAGISIQFDAHGVTIGGDLDTGAPVAFYSGRIDDVRIYDRALSMTELTELARR